MFAHQALIQAEVRRNETSPISKHKTAAYLDAILAQDRAKACAFENACLGKQLGLHLINQKRRTPGTWGNRPVHSAKVRSLSAVHGLTISMSISSKSLTLRVATAMPRDRAIAAIWQSTGGTGRPAERRMSAIIA